MKVFFGRCPVLVAKDTLNGFDIYIGPVQNRNAEMRPEVRDKLAHLGSVTIGSTPEEFGAYIRDEMLRFKKLIKEANIGIN